jgi:hypothetical protein
MELKGCSWLERSRERASLDLLVPSAGLEMAWVMAVSKGL